MPEAVGQSMFVEQLIAYLMIHKVQIKSKNVNWSHQFFCTKISQSVMLPAFVLIVLKGLFDSQDMARETVPLQTSDMGKKTLSVLAHKFLLPQRANSGYILFIYPLR